MPQHAYVVRPSRIGMLIDSIPQEDRRVEQRFDSLKRYLDSRTVLLAGQTLNTNSSSFGIVIFCARCVSNTAIHEARSGRAARRVSRHVVPLPRSTACACRRAAGPRLLK